MQIAFLVTPVIYKPELLSNRLWVLTHLNPFASFLSLLREPLLGQVPEHTHYWLAGAVAFGGLVLTLPVFVRFRARIPYWL
jgi:lipopolysaccharide transport system permease protein